MTEIDKRVQALWDIASTRGYRVDVTAVLRAQRANPKDSMGKQITSNLRAGARVHPTIHSASAVTGRMSMSGPNLQGLSPEYRKALKAEDGHVLVGCDLDRFEPTIAAALSQDEALIAAVQPGTDLYLDLARRIYGEVVEPGDPRRALAKTALIAVLYGQGASSLAERLACALPTAAQVQEARALRAAVLEAYPRLAAWVEQLRLTAAAGSPVVTRGGRQITVAQDGEDPTEVAYRAINYVVQGSAADYFKRSTLRVDAALSEARMPNSLWLPIHDELVLQVVEDRAEEARVILERSVSRLVDGVRVTGSAQVFGDRFGK
ncbi:DNA polymerase [Microbacterium sp. No. 7]|uniref:DNA polymerase n=1 Tax=Microbacterium sp. No. 7 TaxID=1714373 RepID=UPI00300A2256